MKRILIFLLFVALAATGCLAGLQGADSAPVAAPSAAVTIEGTVVLPTPP